MKLNSIKWMQEYSIPLVAGIFLSLFFANIFGAELYETFLHYPLLGKNITIANHIIDFHFLFNDIFMTFFFGIVTVEIVQALSPKGALHPFSKAGNPIFATFGGVIGPILLYLLMCKLLQVNSEVYKGWGIPTCTDIAIAWLAARSIFGNKHPAISYLLLLAIADDAIGLVLLGVFYPDSSHPFRPYFLILVAIGVIISIILRRKKIKKFGWYLLLGGCPSWLGLLCANLHPALALVFIVPFMPAGKGQHSTPYMIENENTTLARFEITFKKFIDFGLIGFGLANANVPLSSVNEITLIVLIALTLGKIIGIMGFAYIAMIFKFSLPSKMNSKELFLLSMLGGLGMTIPLFIAGQAFPDLNLQMPAKMGALLSVTIYIPAYILSKIYQIKKI